MVVITFHTEQLCLRGSTVSLYDYAYYNEKILHNKSIIITGKKNNEETVLQKFLKNFEIRFYDEISNINLLMMLAW